MRATELTKNSAALAILVALSAATVTSSALASESCVVLEVSGFANLYQQTNPETVRTLSIDPVPVPLQFLAGQEATVTATGCVVDWATNCTGPDGAPSLGYFRGLTVYSLIGRWSTSPTTLDLSTAVGPSFFVGASATLTAPAGTGPFFLFLGDNDGIFGDNGGHYDVTVCGGYPFPLPIDIDIKPGSYPNSINPDGHGVIPVAILGSATFDVTTIDVSTLSFAGLAVRVRGRGVPQCSIEDVSGDFSVSLEGAPDGFPDLVCQFVDDPSTWTPGDAMAEVTFRTYLGLYCSGWDSIRIVPPPE